MLGKVQDYKYTIFPAHSFLAEHVMTHFLEKGFRVHGIVKDDCRQEFFQELKKKYDKFDYSIIDLDNPDHYKEALSNSKYIYHLPYSLKNANKELNDQVLIRLDTFLKCAKDVSGLEKIILISTMGTICDLRYPENLFKAAKHITERSYNEEADMDNDPKSRIRVNMEKLFFELVKRYEMNYAVFNTGFFVGPLLSKRTTGKSIEYIKSFFENKDVEAVYPLVDVRDVAKACFAVTTNDSYKGKYMITDERLTYPSEVYEILQRQFPNYRFKKQEKTGNKEKIFDTSKAKMELRLQLRPREESIIDMVNSMKDYGIIQLE